MIKIRRIKTQNGKSQNGKIEKEKEKKGKKGKKGKTKLEPDTWWDSESWGNNLIQGLPPISGAPFFTSPRNGMPKPQLITVNYAS